MLHAYSDDRVFSVATVVFGTYMALPDRATANALTYDGSFQSTVFFACLFRMMTFDLSPSSILNGNG